jgi:cellulose biosynthesis protein BcsQ
MVDRRKSLHGQVMANARLRHPAILTTEVPYWSAIEQMSVRRAPLPFIAPRSAAALVFAALWQEVCSRLPAR